MKDKSNKMTDLCRRFIEIINDKKMKKYSSRCDFDNDLLLLQNEMLLVFE